MLSENLKNLRKAKGFSQEELAARLHVVRQTVSKWEKGRSVPDAELLVRLRRSWTPPPRPCWGRSSRRRRRAAAPRRSSWAASPSSWR